LVKKEFTSCDVAAVVRELNERIVNSRVSNIYQLNNKTLLFKLHKSDESDLQLILESGRRLHLTAFDVKKPTTPPAFSMALRKHLRNCRLETVQQHEFDRVVVFGFYTKSGTNKLILELFGEGNVILVGQDNAISQALTYKRMRDREIIRGKTFSFAPSAGANPLRTSEEELKSRLGKAAEVEVVRALARSLSIGGDYSEEVLLRAGVEKDKVCSQLNSDELKRLYLCLIGVLAQVTTGKLQPQIVLDSSGQYADVVPISLKRFEGCGSTGYGSFNEALDCFYARFVAAQEAVSNVQVDQLKRETERLKRMIAEQEGTLVDTEANADKERKAGDAIYAHFSLFQTVMDRFLSSKQEGRNWETVIAELKQGKDQSASAGLVFESFDGKRQVLGVNLEGVRVGLDLKLTLFENAAVHYDRSKKAKQKMLSIKEAIEESRGKLVDTGKKLEAAESSERTRSAEMMEKAAERRVRKKAWFEKFRWFVSSDGFLVVGGKDAVSNEVLVKKYVEDGDVVFHADIVGAPFVTVRTDGKNLTEQALREAGQFAAAYSRGWREGFGSVDVYWVKPEQLSKTGPSGESVGHGAFAVSGQRNWQRGVALKLAVGVVLEHDELRFVGGPVDAVKAKTDVFATVVPGEKKGKEIARDVLGALALKVSKDVKEKVLRASVEQVREFIPFGLGTVLEG
jgi:predicted ribosome quality control (RQC) complex YloA/Tae2 family protein